MLKILGSIFVLVVSICADVQMKVQDEFIKGDAVSITIKATGKNISIDPIASIDGFTVQNGGKSNNIQIYNGNRTQETIQRFVLFPDKTITIPPIKVIIDGKEHFTKEKIVTITKPNKTQSSLFDLSIDVNKKDVYVGEDIELTLTFKYATTAKIIDLQFKDPVFENFWSKQYGKATKQMQNGYVIQKLRYLLFPQKSGALVINPVKLDLAVATSSDPFSFLSGGTNKRLYSNEIPIDVKPLPSPAKLIGDFSISSKVNTTKVESGEAVSFDIEIEGRGNVDDIEDLKINIPNATIYENKPEKKYNVDTKGKYGGTYKKTFSIVAQSDFVIDPIVIQYFDKNTQEIKTIQTKQHTITVLNAKTNPSTTQPVLEKLPEEKELKEKVIVKTVNASYKDKVIYFILGMIVMAIVITIVWIMFNRKQEKQKEQMPIQKQIKKTQTQEELLKLLVVYLGQDEQLDSIIYSLESKNSVELKELKKDLMKIVERIKI